MANILVVDDRPLNRQLLVTLLGYSGHTLREAEDGAEALEQVGRGLPDLVITDIVMPRMDGVEFVRQLRAMPGTPMIPVIFYTATYRTREARVLAEGCGVATVLAKPAEPQMVLDAVNAALGVPCAPPRPQPPQAASPDVGRTTAETVGHKMVNYVSGLQEVNLRLSELILRGQELVAERQNLQKLCDTLEEALNNLQTVGLRMSSLIEMGLELSSEREPRILLDKFCRAAQDLLGAKYAGVGVLDDDARAVRYWTTRGVPRDVEATLSFGVPSGLLALALGDRKPCRVRGPDLSQEALGLPKCHPPVHSLLVVPLATPTGRYGWLYAADKLGADEFGGDDEQLAAALAGQAAVAYENVTLYDELQVHAADLQQEIEERRRTEKELAEASAKYRSIFENSVEAIVQTTPDGRYLSANPAQARMLGYDSPGELISAVTDINSQVYVDPRQRDRLKEIVERDGIALGFEAELRRKDGSHIWTRQNVRAARDEHGRIALYEGMWEDITEAKQSAEALRESEERFRQIAENIREVFYVIEPDFSRIHYVSPAYREIWGRSLESLYESPMSWAEAILGEDRPAVMKALEAGLRGDDETTYRITRPDGAVRWIHARSFGVRNAEGTVYRVVGVAEDITETKRLQQQLFQAQKMEAIGTLAGGVAHDFNNILTAMMGYAQLALFDEDLSPETREYLGEIPGQGNRASQLIDQLLTFSRRAVVSRQPMVLTPIVKETAKMLDRTLADDVTIRVHVAEGLPAVEADATQMQQVLMNLAVNAGQAMPGGGEVAIGLDDVTLDETYCRQYAEAQPGRYVCLSVRDTGVGMGPDVQAHIFEPFFTTKEPGKGTGLGLATVYGIVKDHGGHINVYSEPGRGSLFRAYIPVLADAPVSEEAVRQETPVGRGETILLVENEDRVLKVGCAMLKKLGYVVVTAPNGEEALAIIKDQPGIALVVSDMVMPGMGGKALFEALLLLDPDLRMVIASGYGPPKDVAAMLDRGLKAFVQKPFDYNKLGRTVREALDE